MKIDRKKLFITLFILFILLPLGLITEYSAWGEWDNEVYKKMIGFIPKGIAEAKTITPLIPDYGEGSIIIYYLSAIIGSIIIYLTLFTILKLKKSKNETD